MPTKREKAPEVSKMLTLSTAHIQEKTASMLQGVTHRHVAYLEAIVNGVCPPVYAKEGYGYFLFVDADSLEEYAETMPEDLYACCSYAKEQGCEWLCLDEDGPVMEGLKTYEWNA